MARYDIFLSHNSKDKDIVEQLARRLRDKYDLKVWLDKWNLIPGEPWQEEIEKAPFDCKTAAVFIGPSGIGPWENEEMRVTLDARVNKKVLRVIPVLLPGAPDKETLKLPAFLARLTWVDFRAGLDDETAFYTLVCGIRGNPPGDPGYKAGLQKLDPESLPEPGPLPFGSRMPIYHNAIFTGREDDLKALAKVLLHNPQNKSTGVLQAITCMIGIGKTQLAVEFCHRFGRYFQGVHWINARQDIQAEIAACGAEMGLSYWPDTTVEQLRVTLYAWQKEGPRLLILDCLDEPDLLREWLPRLGGFRVLLTTRRHEWPPDIGLQMRRLGLLPRPQSLTLLRKLAPRLTETSDAELGIIAEQLGDLPLALDLAGRYLGERPALTSQGYLNELHEVGGALRHTSLLDWVEGDSPTAHETNLTAAFLLSWQQLDEDKTIDAAAIKVFSACGYCAPKTPIPREIFRHLVGNEQLADRVIKRLQLLGLLSENTDIHPLLAEFARIQDTRKKSLKALAEALAELSYESNRTGLPASFVPLRPHLEIAVRAADEANMVIADDLWGNLGCHLRIVAEFEGSRESNQRALTIDEAVFGSDDTRTALRLNNLGRVLQVTGEMEGAKQHYRCALVIDHKKLGRNHPTVALRHNNLGMILKDLGDLPRAKRHIERALMIDRRLFEPNHPSVIRDMNNLGWVLKDMYKLEDALAAFQHTLAMEEATLGQDHPKVARAINNVGWVLKDIGKFDQALDNFQKAHIIDEHALGPEHPRVAEDLNNIGWILKDMGKLEEALDYFQQARIIDEAAYSPNHPKVARDISNRGFALKDLGKFQDAWSAFENVLDIYQRVYSPVHPEVANIFNGMATLLKDQGMLEAAKQHYLKALVIDEKVFGREHLSVARDSYSLGVVLIDLGDKDSAERHIEWALVIYEKFLPIDHANIRFARENLANLRNQTGRSTAAD